MAKFDVSLTSSFIDLETIDLLIYPVPYVDSEAFWDEKAEVMEQKSYTLSLHWFALIVVAIAGNMLLFWGFGQASERMTRRVRDDAFQSLLRQIGRAHV